MKYYFLLVLFILGCSRSKQESINRFSDEALVQIYELQDQRNTRALLPFLKAKKEEHRITARSVCVVMPNIKINSITRGSRVYSKEYIITLIRLEYNSIR